MERGATSTLLQQSQYSFVALFYFLANMQRKRNVAPTKSVSCSLRKLPFFNLPHIPFKLLKQFWPSTVPSNPPTLSISLTSIAIFSVFSTYLVIFTLKKLEKNFFRPRLNGNPSLDDIVQTANSYQILIYFPDWLNTGNWMLGRMMQEGEND